MRNAQCSLCDDDALMWFKMELTGEVMYFCSDHAMAGEYAAKHEHDIVFNSTPRDNHKTVEGWSG